jgi:hypothetical protein
MHVAVHVFMACSLQAFRKHLQAFATIRQQPAGAGPRTGRWMSAIGISFAKMSSPSWWD